VRTTLGRLCARALTVLACGILAGCMVSERPMFSESDAVRPLPPGRYTTFERADGGFKESDPVEVKLRGTHAYEFIDEKGEAVPVSLHRLADSRFIVQAENVSSDGSKDYAYMLLEISGDSALVYAADCGKQDRARMESLGVVVRRYECQIDAVKDPRGFFAGLDYGPPTSKMVRK
jgi:hypothetical protein